ncbi:MAG: MATE family efflux transporter [Coriobacteriia bacterium]|nr:MATE family efflux transporter [Coriobacteriia bacterium]
MFCVGTLSLIVCFLGGEVDNVIAGNFINENALAAVGIVASVYNVIVFFSVIVGDGGAIYYSRFIGKFQKDNAYKSFCTSIFGTIIMGVVLCILITVFEDPILNFFGVSPGLLEYTHEYYSCFKFVGLVYPLYWLLYETVYNDGDEKIAALSDVIQLVFNLILSFVLCQSYGLAGVSMATFICIVLSTLSLLIHFFKKSNSVKIKLAFNIKYLLNSIRYSVVEASTYLYSALITTILNKYFIMSFGDFYLPILNVALFGYALGDVGQGIGNAITPFVCIYNSEKNNSGIKTIMKFAIKASIVTGIILSLVTFLCADLITSFLGVVTPELVEKSIFVLRCFSITAFLLPIGYCFSQYYLITGRFAYGIVFIAIIYFIAPYFCIVLGYEIAGLDGTLIGFGVYPLAATLVIALFLLIKHGKKFPFLLKDRNNHVKNINVLLNKDSISSVQEQSRIFLNEYSCSTQVINRVELLIEEIAILVIRKNRNKVIAEFTIIIEDDKVKIIERDNGVLFDITNVNQQCDDLNVYLLSNFMEYLAGRVYLKSTGFNRCSFLIDKID